MATQSKPTETTMNGREGSSTAEDLFSCLTDRAKKATSTLRERGETAPSSSSASKTMSSHTNFLSRSPARTNSISSGAAQPDEPQPLKLTASAPNTPVQEDSLFQRLTQRANKAADKLRRLSSKETTPQTTPLKSTSAIFPLIKPDSPSPRNRHPWTNGEGTVNSTPPIRKSSLSSSSKIPTRSASNSCTFLSEPRLF